MFPLIEDIVVSCAIPLPPNLSITYIPVSNKGFGLSIVSLVLLDTAAAAVAVVNLLLEDAP